MLSQMYIGTQRTRYSCPILRKHEFSRSIFEYAQKSNFTKIHLVGAELFCEEGTKDGRDGRTGMDEANNLSSKLAITV
jgi:hypothetical protein